MPSTRLEEETLLVGGPCHGTRRIVALERCETCGHPADHEGMIVTRGQRITGRGCAYGVNADGAGIRCGCRDRARIPRISNLLDVHEVYVRYPCTYISAHAMNPTQPELVYVRDIYLWSGFYQDHRFDAVHPAANEYIMQAVMQWYLQSMGFVSKADGGLNAAKASPNGSGPAMWYVAVCHACDTQPGVPLKIPFESLSERAKWADAHIEGTGHALTYTEEPRTTVEG